MTPWKDLFSVEIMWNDIKGLTSTVSQPDLMTTITATWDARFEADVTTKNNTSIRRRATWMSPMAL